MTIDFETYLFIKEVINEVLCTNFNCVVLAIVKHLFLGLALSYNGLVLDFIVQVKSVLNIDIFAKVGW